MSDTMDSYLTSGDNDDASKHLMTFCMRLIHHSKWKSWTLFTCGSTTEIPYYYLIAIYNGISYDKLDRDLMIHCTSSYTAFNQSAPLPEKIQTDAVVRIFTDDVHAGYVRLIREEDNMELRVDRSDMLKYGQALHGPAVLLNTKRVYTLRNKYTLSNVDADKVMSAAKQILSQDLVLAVHSPYWPVEAAEWITRTRSHGFPFKSVIKQVVRYGCDFVCVSHNRLCDNNEWRFSFSKAEQILAKIWSISQKVVYSALWVINKRIKSSNLCTYYFKTLMFWACEEKPNQFWHDKLLVQSVRVLLIEMMKWVKSKFCVNYFIPSNNMMDHLNDTDLSYEIAALWKTSQSYQLIEEVIHICREVQLQSVNVIYHIELPAWIKRAFIIYQRILNDHDNYTNLFCTNLTIDFQNALYVELSDIYRAICFQQKSVSCVNVSDKYIHFLESQSHLLFAVNLCESRKRDMIQDCNEEIMIILMRMFMPSDKDISGETSYKNVECNSSVHRSTIDRQNTLNYNKEQKCLLYRRFVEKHENKVVNNYWSKRIKEGRIVNIEMYCTNKINPSTEQIQIFKAYPGVSPTVNISWFIAKAYLANLYYTTQRDVSLVLQTCEDIINVHKLSNMNEMYSEHTFPVVLSTQWTSIYDKEIQKLLGFYSLCSYVFDAISRSVYLGVCPVQFALYLKVRVALDQFNSDHWIISIAQEYSKHYFAHRNVCDRTVNNGDLTVQTVLIVLTRNLQ